MVEALIALAAAVGSAVIAARAKTASEQQARVLLERARNEYGELDIPKLEELAGKELPPTELAKIQADPAQKQAQQNALSKMEELGQGGFNLQDEAVMNAAMGKVSRQEGAGRAAIEGNMAARGTLGSGAELAMQLQNHQQSANSANAVGMDAAARAQSRAYDSILAGGKLAGQMRDQDYAEQSQKAKAQDMINRYNGQNRSNAVRDHYQMQVAKIAGMNGQNAEMAKSYRNDGNTNADLAGGIGTAANEGISQYANSQNKGTNYESPQNPDSTYTDDYLERMRRQGP